MTRIAIVDDDKNVCNQIEEYIRKLSREMMFLCTVDVYYDGEHFCNHLLSGCSFDLIFLDIELKELNGVEVGRIIREQIEDQWTQIVFISIRKDYAMELFQIRPMDFLVKPIDEFKIKKNLSCFFKLHPDNDLFIWKQGGKTFQVSYRSILYFSSENKEVVVCTKDAVSSFYGKLSDIEKMLPPFFWRIHRSHIVNQNYIYHHLSDQVELTNGLVFPISKQYRSVIRKKIIELHSYGGEDFFK